MKLKISFFASIISLVGFAQSAPSYYSGVNFNKTKNELKSELATLITTTHTKTISYSELQTLLKSSDVDPQNPSNLLLIYGSQASGTHQRSRAINGSWNREHVYAKSKGTPNLGTSGPGADGHHLRPADNTLNSTRGSLLFDDGTGATAYKTSRGGWYPGEEWKGDVARILMYMYVRYNTRCLPLNITMNPATYSSDFPDILLKWNVEDPVSDFERQRNNVVANTQKNRNPFIDNPYLATVIWGGPAAQNTWPDTFNGGSTTDTEAPTVPTNLSVTGTTSSSISLSWTASTDNVGVSGYDIYANNTYKTTVTTTSGTVSGLDSSTTYILYVVAKDAAGNKSNNSDTVESTTSGHGNPGEPETTCGTEDFETIPATNSSYLDRQWVNKGITWTATYARTDKQIHIDGDNNRAICLRKGSLKSSTISGGVGSLTVKTYLPFSDSDGNYTLKINGVVKGQIPYSKTAKTYTINDINVDGNVVIELVDDTTSNRVSFDNLSWTCYAKMAVEESASKNQKLTVYPNPVKNSELFISGISKNETVQIYTANGQLVQTINNVNNNEKISLKKLSKGVYFVKTKSSSTKVIVD
ncbi:endonuclease [Epilithonimonas hungarica]|uniref:Por secretion system C-terminal sorting domain-containing protein n=1 Tax=Epilithonimonas hungarica TaxID=454006 RepID=A0A1G7JZR2_9FLAO|nr:endonuclease [Epilithonimonas hungarica]SDF30387.1 Por secretion system C-terminal sorting domain-containing protein [Epilithonimonas hungarica]